MSTWSASYETTPAQADSPSSLGTTGRGTRVDIRERMENEHSSYSTKGGTSGGSVSADFLHKEGSARGYYASAAPTVRPDGSTSLGTGDDGRIWVDSDDKAIYVWTGTAWTLAKPSGDISVGDVNCSTLVSSGAVSGTTITGTGAISGTTITGSGNVTGAGFTTGDVVVKFKKLTGTAGTSGSTTLAHGSSGAKIIGVGPLMIEVAPGVWYEAYNASGGGRAAAEIDATTVKFWHASLGAKTCKCLIIYEA